MSDEAGSVRTSLLSVLDNIERWKQTTQDNMSRRIAELEGEEAQIRAKIESLTQDLSNVASLREEAIQALNDLPEEYEYRAHEAVVKGLTFDAEVLKNRALLYEQACEKRDARAKELMEQPGVAEKVAEFKDFELKRESLLAALPPSYHGAIMQQHENNRTDLQPLFDVLVSEMEPVSEDLVEITLVASMDRVNDVPEALAIILPVNHQVHAGWDKRHEDLMSMVAYRVVAAISATLKTVGAPDAPVVYAPYEFGENQLAIQVWLKDSTINGSIQDALAAELDRLQDRAGELYTAGVLVSVTWQSPEIIAPSTTEQED